MKKLSDILAEMERQGFELGKIYTDKDRPPFKVMEEKSEIPRWEIYIKGEREPFVIASESSREAKKLAHMMLKNHNVKIKRIKQV